VSPKPPVNLAARPFRNERLPGLLVVLALLGLAALSVRHAVLLRQIMPSRTAERHGQIAALEQQLAELRRQSAELRRPDPDKATLQRWASVKDLVDRRAFAWTTLLEHLEATLPRGVRLVSIGPAWEEGQVKLSLQAMARNSEQGFAFVKALEDRPEFEDVLPTTKTQTEKGVSFAYTMRYLPRPEAARAAPGPEAQPADEAP
jgi:Tfp pilus assembly protein PilN